MRPVYPTTENEKELRAFVRRVYGAVFLERVERLVTKRTGMPFKFNHLTGPMILAHPRFEPMMARWIKKVRARRDEINQKEEQ